MSDVKSLLNDAYEEGNTAKIGAWATLGKRFKVLKWLSIESGVTYQERKSLEVFRFPAGDDTNDNYLNGTVFYSWYFSRYPTSPQSRDFDNFGFELRHFPNFKYLNFELVPVVNFGRKINCSIGAGLFYGILLNRNQTIVNKEDLPLGQVFFQPPFNVYGEVRYNRHDFGLTPKISAGIDIGDNMNIGLTFKSYQSLIRLNDTFVYHRDLVKNMRWSVYFMGIELLYDFKK